MADAKSGLRRLAVEGLGWVLTVAGVAALVLPGPGLLLLFAGLAVLSNQYDWAAKRVEPVKKKAFETAEQSVQTTPRILGSTVGALLLGAVGVLWIVQPAAPGWWPVRDSWWLFGGWAVGATLILSALIALGMIVYSFRRFRGGQDRDRQIELRPVD